MGACGRAKGIGHELEPRERSGSTEGSWDSERGSSEVPYRRSAASVTMEVEKVPWVEGKPHHEVWVSNALGEIPPRKGGTRDAGGGYTHREAGR